MELKLLAVWSFTSLSGAIVPPFSVCSARASFTTSLTGPFHALPPAAMAAADDDEPEWEKEDPSLRAFLDWGRRNAIPFDSAAAADPFSSSSSPSDDGGGTGAADERYLRAISEAVQRSSADVVILSEGFHNCAEMMRLHHRIVRYLASDCGFDTVVTESGLPESRDIYDYVLGTGKDDDGEGMWRRGLNKMYAEWEEGRALVRWMRRYNERMLASGGGGGDDGKVLKNRPLHYYGSDIGGFYADWRPPVSKIARYLRDVDPAYEKRWMGRFHPLLEKMGTQARVNYQEKFTPAQRSELVRLLNDVVNHLDVNEASFVQCEGGRDEFEWARQSAASMRLAERYYRNYESRSDLGAQSDDCVGLNVRETAMARNIAWALRRRPNARIVVISHVIHAKTATQYQDDLWGFLVPMGQMLRQKLAEEGKRMFVIGTSYGSGSFWNRWQKGAERRFVDDIPPPKPNGLEQIMCRIGNGMDFFLHWENAPLESLPFLSDTHVMRENDYFIKLNPLEWNACIHLERVTGASPVASADS